MHKLNACMLGTLGGAGVLARCSTAAGWLSAQPHQNASPPAVAARSVEHLPHAERAGRRHACTGGAGKLLPLIHELSE